MDSPYEAERREIKEAFEEGMDELFRTMFTETVYLYPLDMEKTQTNVYNETSEKFYLAPYALSAKVVLTRQHGDDEVQTIQQTVEITAPNKQLVDLGIPHYTDADLEKLQQWAIRYRGQEFLIDKVAPRTHVANVYLFYVFSCTTRDKDAHTVYHFPEPVTDDTGDEDVEEDTDGA